MKSRTRSPLSRRHWLGACGSGLALAPLLPLLAEAQESGPPLRLILMFQPHGVLNGVAPFESHTWFPRGDANGITLSQTMASLEPHKHRLTILRGMDMCGGQVGSPVSGAHTRNGSHVWTGSPLDPNSNLFARAGSENFGWSLGTSIDQTIAASIGGSTPFRSVEAGVRTGAGSTPFNRTIYKGPAEPLSPEDNPLALFDRLFQGFSPAEPAMTDRLAAQRKSVLDVLRNDLSRLGAVVAVDDRPKVEAHLEALRSVERRLSGAGLSCSPVAPPGTTDPRANDSMPLMSKLQIEVLAQAIACGSTRIASLQFDRNENSSTRFTWLWPDEPRGHHELSHNDESDGADAIGKLAGINAWYMEQLAYLMDLLAAVPEGDGSVLDNTIIVWGSEIGNGSDHSDYPVPFLVAGGTSRFQGGRYYDMDGVRHARLLVSLAHLFGLSAVETYGVTDTGRGPLSVFV
jgi:hypothetical protein